MFLRMLVGNYVRSSGAGHLREVASNLLSAPAGPREAWQAALAAASESPEKIPPACDVLLVFATAVEAGGVIDALESSYSGSSGGAKEHLGRFAGKRCLVLESGAGQATAAKALQSALDFYQPAWVILSGFATGLVDDLPRNRILISDEVIDEKQNREVLAMPFSKEEVASIRGLSLGRLLTIDRLLRRPSERLELGRQHQAAACDLESLSLARTCAAAGTPCLSIRIISESAADELPAEMSQLLDQENWFAKVGAFSASLFKRPAIAKELWELQGRAVAAADKLSRFLASVVAQMPAKAE